MGYLVSKEGIQPDQNKYKPLLQSPSSKSHKEHRSFLKCTQYYSKFIPNYAALTSPLYELQTSENFIWNEDHETARTSILKSIESAAPLLNYSFNRPVDLVTDASKDSIGAVLEQNGRIVYCISRRLNDAEKGYAQTQKEGLAVVWAVKRLHKFLYGRQFNIITDHEALKYMFHPGKSIHKNTAAKIQRWSITLSTYNYTLQFRPGAKIPQADFLSRFAYSENPESSVLFLQPLHITRNALIEDTRKEFSGLVYALRNGWSTSSKRRFSQYYRFREHLSIQPDDVILHKDQVLLPSTLRKPVLDQLHCTHAGRDRMISSARLTYWWPTLTEDITNFVKHCLQCRRKLKTHPIHTTWPTSYESL